MPQRQLDGQLQAADAEPLSNPKQVTAMEVVGSDRRIQVSVL